MIHIKLKRLILTKVFDDCKENQKYFETQIENLQNENKILKQKLEDYEKTKEELETIQNSKVWKFVNKILRK